MENDLSLWVKAPDNCAESVMVLQQGLSVMKKKKILP